jgi:hypothetical protein
MSGIIKSIPQKHGITAINSLYNGPTGAFEFHTAGNPARLYMLLVLSMIANFILPIA